MGIIYTNQKSKKRKPNAKQRKLAEDWQKLLKKWDCKKLDKKTSPFLQKTNKVKPFRRETVRHPSLNSKENYCFKKENKIYTGEKVIGITIVHKSCLQPVFNKTEAIDAANMRR